jgi:sugar lactone lactonase YvrE
MDRTLGRQWLRTFLTTIAFLTLQEAAAPLRAAGIQLFVTDGDAIHAFDGQTGAPTLPNIPLLGATGLAIGPNSDLFAASTIPASEIYRFDSMTGTQVGSGPFVTFNGQNDGHDVQNPQGMHFGLNGNLYVADVTNSEVHLYDPAGNSLGALTDGSLVQPTDVAFDSSGNMYVVSGSAEVLRSDFGINPLIGFVATQAGGLTIPQSLGFSPDGKLYVLDIGNGAPAVRRYTSTGGPDGTIIDTSFNFFNPTYLEFGPDGKLYVAGQDLNSGVGQVLRFLTDGTPDGTFVSGLTSPTYMVFSVAEPASATLVTFVALAGLLMTIRKACSR